LVSPLLLTACGAVAPSYRDQSVTIASSANFDPSRYLGRWYEVARYPNPFQADCAGSVVDYAAGEGGEILVRNACLDASGAEIDAITGTAVVGDPAACPSGFPVCPSPRPTGCSGSMRATGLQLSASRTAVRAGS
jgi:lipocalin